MKISMTQVKVTLTALAATILALSKMQEWVDLALVPPVVMKQLVSAAIAFGILGASPIGRLFFKEAASNDIVPPKTRAFRASLHQQLVEPASREDEITKPD